MIQKTISKFSKTKNQTKKRLPKVPKNQKYLEGGLKSKHFIKQTPPKVRILIQIQIQNFQNIKSNSKKTP